MKKKLLLLLGLLLCATMQAIQAQELRIVRFEKMDRDIYARTHQRLDFNDNPCAVLRVSVANAKNYKFQGNIIGDVEYEPGEAIIYMTQRSRNITILSDRSGMLKIDFVDSEGNPMRLEKQVVYELDLKLILPEDQQRRTLVLGNIGYHPAQTSYGVMVGVAAKHGAYLHLCSDFGSVSSSLECDDTGMLTNGQMPYYKEGVSDKARLSFTAGYMCRFWRPLYGYIGAGYGYRTLVWETVEGEKVKNTLHSASGLAAEIGLIGTYKRFAFSVGCHTVDFKYAELNVGIGYFF